MAPRSKDGSNLHAAHEQARLERAEKEERPPTYEARSLAPREVPQSWGPVDGAVGRWLDDVHACEVSRRPSGADLRCDAATDLGAARVDLWSAFEPVRGVVAACEPVLLRATIGEVGPRLAWAARPVREGCLAFAAVSPRGVEVLAMPRCPDGIFQAPDSCLGSAQITRALLLLKELAEAGPEASAETLLEAGRLLFDEKARWVELGRDEALPRDETARVVALALRRRGSFDRIAWRPGGRKPVRGVAPTAGRPRDLLRLGVQAVGQVLARSSSEGLTVEADLFAAAMPETVHGALSFLPRAWAALRVVRGEVEGRRPVEGVDEAVTVEVGPWLDRAAIGEGGLEAFLDGEGEGLPAPRRGPYR